MPPTTAYYKACGKLDRSIAELATLRSTIKPDVIVPAAVCLMNEIEEYFDAIGAKMQHALVILEAEIARAERVR